MLQEWAEMISECTNSGKTVTEWCSETGINVKTYYYRLKKVRDEMLQKQETNPIVPIGIRSKISCDDFDNKTVTQSSTVMKVRKGDIEIELSENISAENFSKLMRILQC